MRVEHYTKTLDDLVTDVIVAGVYEDERPPLGVSGLVDWRLNGFISKAIIQGYVTGKKDEVILLPLHQRLPARRLLLLGLGKKKEFAIIDARHLGHKIGKSLRGLGAVDAALSIPPAKDERDPGDTEKAINEVLHQANLSNETWIRWMAPPTHQFQPAIPSFLQGNNNSARIR